MDSNKHTAWQADIINGPTVRIVLFITIPIMQSTICTISIAAVTTNKMVGVFLHTGMTAAHVNARLLANIYRAFVRLFPFSFITAPIEKQTPRAALTSVVYAFI